MDCNPGRLFFSSKMIFCRWSKICLFPLAGISSHQLNLKTTSPESRIFQMFAIWFLCFSNFIWCLNSDTCWWSQSLINRRFKLRSTGTTNIKTIYSYSCRECLDTLNRLSGIATRWQIWRALFTHLKMQMDSQPTTQYSKIVASFWLFS